MAQIVMNENIKVKLEIGADRLEVSKAKLIGIHYKHLIASRKQKVEESMEGLSVINFDNEKEMQITELAVSVPGLGDGMDNWVIELDLKKQIGLKGAYYIQLSINAPKIFNVTNENNVSDGRELKHLPQLVEKKLSEIGVYVSLEEATMRGFEVNANTTENKFKETFELVSEAWKAELDEKGVNKKNKVFLVDTEDGYESLKLKKDHRTVKVYDKIKQLKDTGQITINENLARIEVYTSHTTTIQRMLGDDITFANFCNNIEAIQHYYRTSIETDIEKPINQFRKRIEHQIFEKLEAGEKPIDVYEGYINHKRKRKLIVDLSVFDNAMKKYYKKHKKANLQRDIKTLHNKVLKKTDQENYESLVDNFARIERFMQQIKK